MRIAVTYDSGTIFQHFGHTEIFKVYDVEDKKIVAEEVLATNGQGHGALAGFLADAKVDICLLYTSPSPRDRTRSRMPSSA